MRLSMWMLNDKLKRFDPEPKINSGEQVLRSARVLSGDIEIEKQNVYLARASEFINGENNRIICVHGQDYILLNTSDMDEVMNAIFDIFDLFNSWSDEVYEMINNGSGVQDIVDRSHEIFGQPILIYNADNEMIGISSEYPSGSLDREWDNILENHSNSPEFLANISEELKLQKSFRGIRKYKFEGTPYGSVYRGLFLDRSWIGRLLILECFHSLTEGELQLTETLGQMIERWAAESDRNMLLREDSAIFRDMLDEITVSREEVDHKLQMAGWLKNQMKQLIRIEIPQADMEISRAVYLRLERSFAGSYVIYKPDVLYLIINLDITPADILEKTLLPILDQSRLCAVASYSFTDIFTLTDHNRQCILTYRYVRREPGQIYYCSDYALDCIHSFINNSVPEVLKHPAIDMIRSYDEKNRTDLGLTLYTYLKSSCNMAETARKLHLHRNSLLYRINQIKSITGIDPGNDDEREYLMISFYMK